MSFAVYINRLKESIIYDSSVSWGIRLAFSVSIPLLFGLIVGKTESIFWAAIAAQSVSLINLKGSVKSRLQTLFSAIFLCIFYCVFGSLVGNVIWLHLIFMFIVGFISTLYKNLGERGVGLALSVYITFIIASNIPTTDSQLLLTRSLYVLFGGLWAFVVAMLSIFFMEQSKPYRISIAHIFKEMSNLAALGKKGFDNKSKLIPHRAIFLQEKLIREQLNNSLAFFEKTATEIKDENHPYYPMVQTRKIASMCTIHLANIMDYSRQIFQYRKVGGIGATIYELLDALQQINARMDIYLHDKKIEERMFIRSRINRINNIHSIVLQNIELGKYPNDVSKILNSIMLLAVRYSKLIERSLELIRKSKEVSVYKSYSLSNILSALEYKHYRSQMRLLFRFDSNLLKYAIRVGLAVFLGQILSYFIMPNHGYWIPFTAIVVAQPYVGATFRKGFERTIGTFLGVLVGSAIVILPHSLWINVMVIFITSILTIYFLQKNYSIASFLITLSLFSLLTFRDEFDNGLLFFRLASTVFGSILSIAMSFLFRSTWDTNQLPIVLREALDKNVQYFINTFYQTQQSDYWMTNKKESESANARAYDSFNRWLSEPSLRKDRKTVNNKLNFVAHNIRLTRELNNYNSELGHEHSQINNNSLKLLQNASDILTIIDPQIQERLLPEKIQPAIYSANQLQLDALEKIIIELKSIKLDMEHKSLTI